MLSASFIFFVRAPLLSAVGAFALFAAALGAQDAPPAASLSHTQRQVSVDLAPGAPKDLKFSEVSTDHPPLEAAISWDGKLLAYCSRDQNGVSIRVREIAGGAERTLLGPLDVGCVNLGFPHDSSYLFYALQFNGANTANAYRISLSGGAPALVARGLYGSFGVAPDGSAITFIRFVSDPKEPKVGEYQLFIASADGLRERVAAVRGDDYMVAHADPSWSPDGSQIAFSVAAFYPGKKLAGLRFAAYDLAGRHVGIIGDNFDRGLNSIAWLSDGRKLAAIAGPAPQKDRVIVKPELWTVSLPWGWAAQLTSGSLWPGKPSVASSGDLLASAALPAYSVLLSPFPSADAAPSATLSPTIPSKCANGLLAWISTSELACTLSPDVANGKWQMAAFPAADSASGDSRVSALACKYPLPVIVGKMVQSNNIQVAYGTYVAEAANTTMLSSLQPCLPGGSRAAVYMLSPFNPGGDQLTYAPGAYDSSDLYGAEYSFWDSALPAALSPDGNYVAAFASVVKDKPLQLLIFDVHGNSVKAKYTLPAMPANFVPRASLAWAQDGHSVSFLLRNDGNTNVWLQPVNLADRKVQLPPVQATHLTQGYLADFALSPDGKQVAFVRYSSRRFVIRISGLR